MEGDVSCRTIGVELDVKWRRVGREAQLRLLTVGTKTGGVLGSVSDQVAYLDLRIQWRREDRWVPNSGALG